MNKIIEKYLMINQTSISQQGEYVKNISKNVAFGGKQKLTRTYKCSKCGSTKHNLQKCPYKYIKSNNLIFIY